jgi:signal recognition particle subunit SRP19
MKGERILYPCYFNALLTRGEGRRIPRGLAVKGPTLQGLEKAVKKSRIPYRVEQKPHPAQWERREGRVIVTWKESKETLLKKIARVLEGER